ncbi:hypothetical protein BDV35DRAFT_355170 [Aspergillus flavus]|uniref:Uncharacterized protein n=1 Tax=Aspergillus flavus TaxID=5059 RepID=A0A5N6GXL5_ASPFL|nr:hypothetical protein BDV35DRAFT_355170 [Aspergillus flavus]
MCGSTRFGKSREFLQQLYETVARSRKVHCNLAPNIRAGQEALIQPWCNVRSAVDQSPICSPESSYQSPLAPGTMTVGLSDPFLMTLSVFIIQVVVVLCVVFCANKLPRRPLLLITTGIMGVSIFVVGCLGIPGGEVSHTFGKVIISFVIIEITAFNFAWGPLGWTIASEMAVGRNRNKNLRCRGSLLLGKHSNTLLRQQKSTADDCLNNCLYLPYL